jgi:outer membrane protein OmpA-like peptidoglycan-associated protein
MLGVRVGVGGWQAKGEAAQFGELYKFNFVQGNADLMLDLTSAFGGFNHRRIANVYLFAGAGVVGAFNNKEAIAIAEKYTFDYLWSGSKCFAAGRFGVGVDFRCSDLISVGVEGNANFMSDKFNSKKTANNLDWNFNLLAGLTFHFGKNNRPSKAYAEAKAVEEAARVAAQKAEEAKKAAAEKAAAEKAAAEKAAAEKAAAEKVAAEKAAAEKAAAERAAIAKEHSTEGSFLIGSYKISSNEAKKLDQLASWLNENTDYTVLVVGYADKQTGTPEGNMELSKKRATAVQKRLISKGVAKERVTVEAKGDTEQPYAQPEKNRIVLCIVQ